MKKYLVLLVILVLSSMLLLTGCGNTPTNTKDDLPTTTTNDNPASDTSTSTTDTTKQLASEITFPLNSAELTSVVSVNNHVYTPAPTPNDLNDISSIRNIKGTKTYEAHMQVDMEFGQTSKYQDALIYMKVLGTGISGERTNLVYEGVLKQGKETITLIPIMQTPAETPRFDFCFGFAPNFDPFNDDADPEIACFTKRLEGATHNIGLTKTSFKFNFDDKNKQLGDNLTATQDVLLKNHGTAPMIFYIYTPTTTTYSVRASQQEYFLKPGEEVSVTFTATWPLTTDPITARDSIIVYSVPHHCELSYTCADEARINEEIEIGFET
ncbi:hypothetical protein K9M74_04750 [Candidatus Woesearchaeota archaeon]|nr:hypothetical protein [Candidatus Woesearchaeota archaeon]